MMKEEKNIPELRFPEFEGEWPDLFPNNKKSHPSWPLLTSVSTCSPERKKSWNNTRKASCSVSSARSCGSGMKNGKEYPEWEEKSLCDIVVINPRPDKVPDVFLYIDLESVEKGNLKNAIQFNQYEAPSRAQRVLDKGDILFQMVRPYQRNNYYFNLEGIYVASTGYAQLRYDYCPKFIYQLVHTDNFVNEVLNRCTGSSYPAINSSDLGDILVLIPKSINEQQKIAAFLSSIDDKINQINTQLEHTRKWKQGLLQKMFV
jgi:type I restriction enzyme, S subunit